MHRIREAQAPHEILPELIHDHRRYEDPEPAPISLSPSLSRRAETHPFGRSQSLKSVAKSLWLALQPAPRQKYSVRPYSAVFASAVMTLAKPTSGAADEREPCARYRYSAFSAFSMMFIAAAGSREREEEE
jgi:hypothetical protein